MSELSKIKIPASLYVALWNESGAEVPSGRLVVNDTTKLSEQRRAAADEFAKYHHKQFNSVELENVPLVGFKVGRTVRSHSRWSGNTNVIQIEDPRGFEVPISVENMIMCMDTSIVDSGEIMSECVWGFEGSILVLLPANSKPYLHYLDTKERLASAVSIRTVKPGDTVQLITGEKVRYFGKVNPVNFKRLPNKTDGAGFVPGDRDLYVPNSPKYFIENLSDDSISLLSAIKVSKVLERQSPALTALEIEQAVNDLIDPTKDGYDWRTGLVTMMYTVGKSATVEIQRVVKTEAELVDLISPLVTNGRWKSLQRVRSFASAKGRVYELNSAMNFENTTRNDSWRVIHHNNAYQSYYHAVRTETVSGDLIASGLVIGNQGLPIVDLSQTGKLSLDDVTEFFVYKVKITTQNGYVTEFYH